MPALSGRISLDDSAWRRGLSTAEAAWERFKDKLNDGRQAIRQLKDDLADLKVDGIREMGSSLHAGLTAPIMAAGGAAIKAAADLESLKMGLKAVAGSTAAAEKQLASLEQVAKLPGLGYKEAIQGSINLQATGISAEQAEKSLMAFGNALATVGKGKADLEGVILALGQIQSKGSISAEEINQIAERVPQIRIAMQQAFGSSNSEELERLGVSSQEFIQGVTDALGKLAPVSSSTTASFENLEDEVFKANAALGKELLPIVLEVTKAATSLAQAWSSAPAALKQTVIGVAGVLAVLGPAQLAFTGVMGAIKTARDAAQEWAKVKEVVGARWDQWTGKAKEAAAQTAAATATTTANTAVTTANAAAQTAAAGTTAAAAAAQTASSGATTANTGATQTNTGATQGSEAARRAHTKALWDEYNALEANSKAEMNNAMAVKASAESVAKGRAAGGGGGGLGGLLNRSLGGGAGVGGAAAMFGGPVGILLTAAGLANSLNELKDAREGKADPGLMATLEHMNPLRKEDPELGKAVTAEDARAKLLAMGETPRQEIERKQREARATARKEAKEDSEAKFKAEFAAAKTSVTGLPEEQQAAAERDAFTPLLEKRIASIQRDAEKLKPLISKSDKVEKEYHGLLEEAENLKQEVRQLQSKALQASAEKAKKAAEELKKRQETLREIATSQFQSALQRAEQRAGDAEEGWQAEAQRTELAPVLEARQKQLADEARALLPQAKGNLELRKQLEEMRKEYDELGARLVHLDKAADKESETRRKKELADQRAIAADRFEAMKDWAKASVARVPEEQRAAAEAAALKPVLAGERQRLAALIESGTLDAKEQMDTVRKIAQLDQSAAELDRKAAEAEKAQRKKRLDEAQKARKEREDVLDLEKKIYAQQLKNAGLDERTSSRMMLPELFKQLRAAATATAGESVKDRRERELKQAQLIGEIGEAAGGVRRLGAGQLAYLNREIRAAQAAGAGASAVGSPGLAGTSATAPTEAGVTAVQNSQLSAAYEQRQALDRQYANGIPAGSIPYENGVRNVRAYQYLPPGDDPRAQRSVINFYYQGAGMGAFLKDPAFERELEVLIYRYEQRKLTGGGFNEADAGF